MGLITLEASDDYCFVETEAHGEVAHYHPRLVCAEKHHMVTVKNFVKIQTRAIRCLIAQ